MPDDLRTRIAKVLTAVAEGRALYQVTNADAAVMADAVIDVVASEYVNSRGMFHEPDRCMGCEDCEAWLEDESRWIRE